MPHSLNNNNIHIIEYALSEMKFRSVKEGFQRNKAYVDNVDVCDIKLGAYLLICGKLNRELQSNEFIVQDVDGDKSNLSIYEEKLKLLVERHKPVFFIVSERGHYTLLALVPDTLNNRIINVVYINSMLQHDSGKGEAQRIYDFLKTKQLDLGIEVNGSGYYDISTQQQFSQACGLSVASNIASVFVHFENKEKVRTLQSVLFKPSSREELERFYIDLSNNISKILTEIDTKIIEEMKIMKSYVNDYTNLIIENELGGRNKDEYFLKNKFPIANEQGLVAVLPFQYLTRKDFAVENFAKSFQDDFNKCFNELLDKSQDTANQRFNIILPFQVVDNRESTAGRIIELIIDRKSINNFDITALYFRQPEQLKSKETLQIEESKINNSDLEKIQNLLREPFKGKNFNLRPISVQLSSDSWLNYYEKRSSTKTIIAAENVIQRIKGLPLTTEHDSRITGAKALREKHSTNIIKYDREKKLKNYNISTDNISFFDILSLKNLEISGQAAEEEKESLGFPSGLDYLMYYAYRRLRDKNRTSFIPSVNLDSTDVPVAALLKIAQHKDESLGNCYKNYLIKEPYSNFFNDHPDDELVNKVIIEELKEFAQKRVKLGFYITYGEPDVNVNVYHFALVVLAANANGEVNVIYINSMATDQTGIELADKFLEQIKGKRNGLQIKLSSDKVISLSSNAQYSNSCGLAVATYILNVVTHYESGKTIDTLSESLFSPRSEAEKEQYYISFCNDLSNIVAIRGKMDPKTRSIGNNNRNKLYELIKVNDMLQYPDKVACMLNKPEEALQKIGNNSVNASTLLAQNSNKISDIPNEALVAKKDTISAPIFKRTTTSKPIEKGSRNNLVQPDINNVLHPPAQVPDLVAINLGNHSSNASSNSRVLPTNSNISPTPVLSVKSKASEINNQNVDEDENLLRIWSDLYYNSIDGLICQINHGRNNVEKDFYIPSDELPYEVVGIAALLKIAQYKDKSLGTCYKDYLIRTIGTISQIDEELKLFCSKKNKLGFYVICEKFGIGNVYHIVLVALVPDKKGGINVIYINSIKGDKTGIELADKFLKQIKDKRNGLQIKLSSDKVISLSSNAQYSNSCGLAVATYILNVVTHYESGKTIDTLSESLYNPRSEAEKAEYYTSFCNDLSTIVITIRARILKKCKSIIKDNKPKTTVEKLTMVERCINRNKLYEIIKVKDMLQHPNEVADMLSKPEEALQKIGNNSVNASTLLAQNSNKISDIPNEAFVAKKDTISAPIFKRTTTSKPIEKRSRNNLTQPNDNNVLHPPAEVPDLVAVNFGNHSSNASSNSRVLPTNSNISPTPVLSVKSKASEINNQNVDEVREKLNPPFGIETLISLAFRFQLEDAGPSLINLYTPNKGVYSQVVHIAALLKIAQRRDKSLGDCYQEYFIRNLYKHCHLDDKIISTELNKFVQKKVKLGFYIVHGSFGIGNLNHFALVVLASNANGGVNIIYINSIDGDTTAIEFAEKFVEQIKDKRNGLQIKLSSDQVTRLSSNAQYIHNCGLAVATYIFNVATHYESGKTIDTLSESLFNPKSEREKAEYYTSFSNDLSTIVIRIRRDALDLCRLIDKKNNRIIENISFNSRELIERKQFSRTKLYELIKVNDMLQYPDKVAYMLSQPEETLQKISMYNSSDVSTLLAKDFNKISDIPNEAGASNSPSYSNTIRSATNSNIPKYEPENIKKSRNLSDNLLLSTITKGFISAILSISRGLKGDLPLTVNNALNQIETYTLPLTNFIESQICKISSCIGFSGKLSNVAKNFSYTIPFAFIIAGAKTLSNFTKDDNGSSGMLKTTADSLYDTGTVFAQSTAASIGGSIGGAMLSTACGSLAAPLIGSFAAAYVTGEISSYIKPSIGNFTNRIVNSIGSTHQKKDI